MRPRLTLAVFAGLLWLLCSGIAFVVVKYTSAMMGD